jgi:hypothetical protein
LADYEGSRTGTERSFCKTPLDPEANPWTPSNYTDTIHEKTPWLAQMSATTQMIEVLNLPKITMMKFSGDPLELFLFMNTFDNIVDKPGVRDAAKLSRLFEYCEGKAKSVIRPCALMSPSGGYAKARKSLKDRFGNEFLVVAEAWVEKVTSGEAIRTNNGSDLQ